MPPLSQKKRRRVSAGALLQLHDHFQIGGANHCFGVDQQPDKKHGHLHPFSHGVSPSVCVVTLIVQGAQSFSYRIALHDSYKAVRVAKSVYCMAQELDRFHEIQRQFLQNASHEQDRS